MTISGTEIDKNLMSHFKRFSSFEKGAIIIHEGDEDDHVYFILSGRVKVTSFSRKGKEIWHSELAAGTFFGEIAALTSTRRSVNIVAETETKLAILTRTELFQLIHHDPDISIWIMQELARRLEERTEKLSALVALKNSQRIRSELLRLARECSASVGDNLVIRPIPNLSELAVKLNTDRENVSREVSALQKLSAIEKTPAEIRILNSALLEAGSDY